MTDRQAIEVMKSDLPYFGDDEDSMTKQTYLLAISAIQERIDREAGCEWCEYFATAHLPNELENKFNYCPMCGHRLKRYIGEKYEV